jgi:hypothetical protein
LSHDIVCHAQENQNCPAKQKGHVALYNRYLGFERLSLNGEHCIHRKMRLMDSGSPKLEAVSLLDDFHLPSIVVSQPAVLFIPQVAGDSLRAGRVSDGQHAANVAVSTNVLTTLLLRDRGNVILRHVLGPFLHRHVAHLHMIAHLDILRLAIAGRGSR